MWKHFVQRVRPNDNMVHAHGMLDTSGCKYIHRLCNDDFYPTAAIFKQTCLICTLYVHNLSSSSSSSSSMYYVFWPVRALPVLLKYGLANITFSAQPIQVLLCNVTYRSRFFKVIYTSNVYCCGLTIINHTSYLWGFIRPWDLFVSVKLLS
jgi:hypothetical protein